MKKNYTKFLFLFLLQICFFWQTTIAQNIEISNSGTPVEPSIMMDPNNPNILVAGSNLNHYYRKVLIQEKTGQNTRYPLPMGFGETQ